MPNNLPDLYSSKPEAPKEKRVEKVVDHDEFVTRKKSLRRKLGDVLIAGDLMDIRRYLISDVLIPAVKDTIFELGSRGLDMLLFNDGRGYSRHDPKGNNTYISYNNQYRNTAKTSSRRERRSDEPREYYRDDDELIFRDRAKAEKVLRSMMAIWNEYHIVQKADLNDLLDETGNFTDTSWGWTDLSSASVDRVRGGYLLNLPRIEHLD